MLVTKLLAIRLCLVTCPDSDGMKRGRTALMFSGHPRPAVNQCQQVYFLEVSLVSQR